ncbi:MAG: DHH family phosphoesterase [Candidatus Saccharimonadales bacterium]
MTYKETPLIKKIIDGSGHILILQADNPDADSLGSSLALEQILGELGKQVSLYCSADMPIYLRYLNGWDRVRNDLPKKFDASIIVDASTYSLFEKLQSGGEMGWVTAKPTIVLDHHRTVENPLTFAKAIVCDADASSTGEVIYRLAKQLGWVIDDKIGVFIMSAILGDTQGLSNELASVETYRTMAELIEAGVNRPGLEEARREFAKMPEAIFRYKARLIERTELTANGRIASVTVGQKEINEFSPLYNPAPLIQNDMLQTADVVVAIVFKHYANGRVTAAIRTNSGYPIADQLAKKMGGGGHANASGFKIVDGQSLEEIKAKCLELCVKLLDNLDEENSDRETIQHAQPKDRNGPASKPA